MALEAHNWLVQDGGQQEANQDDCQPVHPSGKSLAGTEALPWLLAAKLQKQVIQQLLRKVQDPKSP